jgi:hypothetical protein
LAALLLTLAIVSHHFTAMGAVEIVPDPTRDISIPFRLIRRRWRWRWRRQPEGVETQAQLEFLAAEKCDKVQGFLIGRPEPIEHYAKYVGRKAAVFADVIPLRQQQAAGARGRH